MSKKKCMTVEKLIKALKGMNPLAEVSVIPPRTNAYFDVMDCEEEFSHLVSLGTREMPYVKGSERWERYITYLMQWADDHKDKEYEGMSPVCFDEFCDNEDEEEE